MKLLNDLQIRFRIPVANTTKDNAIKKNNTRNYY